MDGILSKQGMGVKTGLNSNQIKAIAIAAMTIDHVTWLLFPGYQKTWWIVLLHMIGRVTAPIMWFFLAEGYHYTRNVKKYIERLLPLRLCRTLPMTLQAESR